MSRFKYLLALIRVIFIIGYLPLQSPIQYLYLLKCWLNMYLTIIYVSDNIKESLTGRMPKSRLADLDCVNVNAFQLFASGTQTVKSSQLKPANEHVSICLCFR